MPYVTSIERLARAEGLRMGIEAMLQARFEDEGLQLMPEINEIHDGQKLEAILKALIKANSLDEVRRLWAPESS